MENESAGKDGTAGPPATLLHCDWSGQLWRPRRPSPPPLQLREVFNPHYFNQNLLEFNCVRHNVTLNHMKLPSKLS